MHSNRQAHITSEKKLELIRSIRKAQADNLAALNKRETILYGKPITQRNNISSWERSYDQAEKEQKEADDVPGRKQVLTLKVRIILSALLLGGYFSFMTATENQYTLEKAMIKTYIAKDFTNNLFAFMEDFPYTLEYEKISTER